MISLLLSQKKSLLKGRLAIRTVKLLLLTLLLLLPLTSAQGARGDSITAPDTVGEVGEHSSLALDSSGNPVIVYSGLGRLKVLRCNDPNCTGNDESIVTIDGTNSFDTHSLALDISGYPVASYSGNGSLHLLHCNDPNCTGGDESVETVDSVGNVGQYSSLVLDGNGYPVVSYYDFLNTNLKLVRCNDPNCSNGDESIETVDSAGRVGRYSSLVLDGNGYPVVSYFDDTSGDLKLVRCNDPNCSGGDESIVTVDSDGSVGRYTSLALDGSGYPVVSYQGFLNLKVLRCNDPNCIGGDESIESVEMFGSPFEHTSLALDASGYPVVSYHDLSNGDLKVLRCNDPNCTGNDESIVTVDSEGSVGWYTSLALDGSGYPVVSYYDLTNRDLKVLRCNDPNCDNAAPTAADDDYSTGPDTTLAVTAPGVLSNDDDSDGDSLTAILVTDVANGTLTLNASGSFNYMPNARFSGDDSFTYRVTDGRDSSDIAMVSITINHPPVCDAATPSVSTLWPPNGQFHPITIGGISDVEGDAITITVDSIFQDEPVDGEADGGGVGTETAEVRAEREGKGNGRFYHIGFTADDGNGGTCSGSVQVSVPKNMGSKGAALDDGPLHDSTVGNVPAAPLRRAARKAQAAAESQPQLFLPFVSSQ